ncbi:MAG: D-alanine--D-alanine ligase [Deltaproteobacteria bacterium]|nr:D-alanine--D-alanine ligase [Deltaproteobacteria bacterium]
MRRRRVLVVMHEELIPPESTAGLDEAEIYRWKMEFDALSALRGLGHEVIPLGVSDDLAPIRRGIEEHKPHLVFNLLGHFQGITLYDAHVISWLELRRTPYTGCNPRGLLLSSDKVLSKKILAWHRIPIPGFKTFRRGLTIRAPRRLRFPLFVKSAAEHASIGIAQASIVHTEDALVERVRFVHESIGTDALAEEYVEGRELYVGVLGNQRLTVFPTWEMTFESLPKGTAPIATSKVKWSVTYQEKLGVKTALAKGLPPALEAKIPKLARRIYKALGLSGYARIDLRLDAGGRVFVLEANANPDLSRDEDFAESARATGVEYPDLLQRIMNLGVRYMPAWKEEEA